MKITRFYRSFLQRGAAADKRALTRFRQLCWEEPAEEDCLRDTAIARQRLEFIRRLVEAGKLEG